MKIETTKIKCIAIKNVYQRMEGECYENDLKKTSFIEPNKITARIYH